MRASGNPSILVADDDPAVARSVGRLVGRHFPSHTVTSLSELSPALERYQATILLFDLMWQSHAALPELSQLAGSRPTLRICMHSGFGAVSFVTEAFRLGARGYLVKPASADELHAAITAIASGEIYLSAELAGNLALWQAVRDGERLVPPISVLEFGTAAFRRSSAWLAFDLGCTKAESVVLLGIAMGLRKDQVARRIGCAESTVAGHQAAIYRRYRASHGVINPASIGRWVQLSLARMPAAWAPD